MTAVYYFSGSGHSQAVAEFLAQQLRCGIWEISDKAESVPAEETAIVVFPVYCQNIPHPVKAFLPRINAKYVALIATYGKISYGNVLYEAQKLVQGEVIAGAYIPMGHTFLGGGHSFDTNTLLPMIERVASPQKAHIPKTRKNPLADIFPGLRSRIGVEIIKLDGCDHCGICETGCPMGAVKNGNINSQCIRCLHCVTNCPQNALQYKNSRILQAYLDSYRKEEFILYL